MWQGLVFLYLDSHMGLGRRFALMQLLSNTVGFAAIPVWERLAQRFDKSRIWLAGMAFFALFDGFFLLLGPGSPWWQAFILMALIHISFSCLYLIVPSILSDVVDYAEWKFHQHRGATYFALNNFLAKTGFGVGGAIALGLAGHYGVQAAQKNQSVQAVEGLHLAYILLPIALVIVSSVFVWLTPIDRRRHGIVRRRIEARAERLTRSFQMGASR